MIVELGYARLDRLWKALLNRCQLRVICNSNLGGYALILDNLDKIIKAIRPKKVDKEKKFIAQNLKANMKLLFALVKIHVFQGVSGISLVLY